MDRQFAAKTESEATGGPAPKVIVAGHICLDIIPTLWGAFEFVPGKLIEAGAPITAAGGQVPNTGLALHRLGIDTRLIAKIGDDLFGGELRRILETRATGLSSHLVVTPGEFTSYSVILSPPASDRMFIHATGSNATFERRDVDIALAEDVHLFHFGYPTLLAGMCRGDGDELAALMADIKATGATTSLDMSLPDLSGFAGQVDWRLLLERSLPHIDLFLPSIEEILLMLRPKTYESLVTSGGGLDTIPSALFGEIAAELIAMGAKIVGLKAGHRGLYLRTAGEEPFLRMGRARPRKLADWSNRELWAPCFAVDVVGTTGAGDSTIAGFLMGLLRGMSPEQAANAGCAVGACCVEAADAQSGVKTWPETTQRLQTDWPKLKIGIEQNGRWRWDKEHSIWNGPSDSRPT